MPEYGYTKRLDREREYTGCGCREDFEHDGPCPNALREKKAALCQPCSSGWHHPYACPEYVRKQAGGLVYTFQCARCGWDNAEHPISEEAAAKIIDSRAHRD